MAGLEGMNFIIVSKSQDNMKNGSKEPAASLCTDGSFSKHSCMGFIKYFNIA